MIRKITNSIFTISVMSMMFFMSSCNTNPKIELKPYPQTAKDSVVDNYFGTEVADPYRWLEDDNSEATAAWVKSENEVTFDYLSQIPYREALRERLSEIWNYRKTGQPSKHGDYYYYFDNDGLQNQSILYRSNALAGEGEVFLDPNKLSEDGTVALSSVSFSKDNRYMAYSVAASGSDWVEIRVKDTNTGEDLKDVIKWVKFSGASWTKDGFYYSRYDEPTGSAYSAKNEYQKVYFHKLGDDQSRDKLVYWDSKHPLRYFSADVCEDDKYLFVSASEGTHGSEILYKQRNASGSFKTLLKGFENDYVIVHCEGDRALVYTNDNAPLFRLAEMNLKDAKPVLKDLIPANETLMLEGVSVAGGYIYAFYLNKAQSQVVRYDMDGQNAVEVELPGIGSVSGLAGKQEDTTLFYTFSSYTTPSAIYKYDVKTNTSELYNSPKVNFDASNYVCTQVFYPSKDSTMVSMFIVHRKDIKLNGKNPAYLYGYGGFNISLTPGFSPMCIALLEQGGVYAVANLRGGGEYGESWHRGGMLENKQNVFDDFISAAEYLIAEGYTSKEKISIAGGSNGGLLVGACLTQRPDLYAVAFPAVGVLDMLRYHKFTIGWGWAVEYGSSDYADQFEYIYKYSPLHNIKKGVCYPATLITTADHDDRVVPAHSFKFGATLQEAQGCDKPVLLRIESNAGHGAGKPTSKRIEEQADQLSFLFYNTNSKVRFDK